MHCKQCELTTDNYMTIQELHVKTMEEKYSEKIKEMIENTRFYDDNNLTVKSISQEGVKNVSLLDADTSSAIFKYAASSNHRVCALNFASFTNPGGGYMIGSHAQEECLCADSCLYNVLSSFDEYYEYNRNHKNEGLYENRALYTPKVIFKNTSSKVKCDILTCAAPNRNVFVDNTVMNKKALKNRIRFALNIIREEHPDVIILGAWGCGAFGQSATVVANYFMDLMDEYLPNDIEVVFAIPKSFNGNYDAFKDVMLKNIEE